MACTDLIWSARFRRPGSPAHALLAGERLTGHLEQGARVGQRHQSSPILNRAKRRTTTASPSLPDISLTSCPMVLLSSLTNGCSSRVRSADELLDLALDDLGADGLRLALGRHLLLGDPPLPLEQLGRDVFGCRRDRVGRGDVQRESCRQCDELASPWRPPSPPASPPALCDAGRDQQRHWRARPHHPAQTAPSHQSPRSSPSRPRPPSSPRRALAGRHHPRSLR